MIQRVPKIDSESGAGEELANVAGEVEFRNVDFCYPSRPESPVLANFSLRVPAGHTVALVGPSGSGKSTAIALLERFYDSSAGEVALDGVDIRADGARQPGARHVRHVGAGEHTVRRGGCYRGGGRRRSNGGQRPQLHIAAAAGLRHAGKQPV